MAPDRPRRARVLAWCLREAPLALGVAGGGGLAWWLGRAFVLDGHLSGYRWPDYVFMAWMIERAHPALYDPFRYPLHGALVAWVGERLGSYPDAATLIASLSVLGIVAGAGLGARALANPWAGALAALTVPMCIPVADAARWGNLYPLLAGFTALAVGAAAVLARWPNAGTALFAGAAAALAWGTDARGLPVAALVAGAALLGAGRALRARGALAALLVAGAFAAPLVAAPRLIHGWGVEVRRAVRTEQYVELQRGVVRHWAFHANDPALEAACTGLRDADMLRPSFLGTPCSRVMLRHNLERTLPRQAPFGAATWLLALGLLLPGRRGWAATAQGGAIGLGVVGLVLLSSALMPLPERYVLQLAGPLAMLAPAALGRLADTLPAGGSATVANVLFAAAAAFGVWRTAPSRATPPLGTRGEKAYDAWNAAADLARARLPPGATFLDCAAHSVNIALLPRETWPGEPVPLWPHTLEPAVRDLCVDWVTRPRADAWVGVGIASPANTALAAEPAVAEVTALVARTPGWSRVGATSTFALYRWDAPAAP